MNPYSDLDTYVRRLHELERRDRASDLVNSLHTTDIPPGARPGAFRAALLALASAVASAGV
jgi:hypothetical protein